MKNIRLFMCSMLMGFMVVSPALNAASTSPKKILVHSINSVADGAKIGAKLSLCLYASYLCIDRGYKAMHHTVDYLKHTDIKYLINHISKPAKQALIIAGLALVAYECYQSLRHDVKR